MAAASSDGSDLTFSIWATPYLRQGPLNRAGVMASVWRSAEEGTIDEDVDILLEEQEVIETILGIQSHLL